MEENKPFEFHFHVKKKKYKEDPRADQIRELETHVVKFTLLDVIDENPDLYFIKLVAGRLKKRYNDLIIIVSEEQEGDLIKVQYRRTEDLQVAWADGMEVLKSMINNFYKSNDSVYRSSVAFYTKIIIKHETFLVIFSEYVSRKMVTHYKQLTQKSNTLFEITSSVSEMESVVLRLMSVLDEVTGALRPDLKQAYFEGSEDSDDGVIEID